jgi:SAM-dependent methyltransferase
MKNLEKNELTNRRQKLLQGLKGNILEIGCGTGVNFPYYSQDCKVYALEPNSYMWEVINKKEKSISKKCEVIPIQSVIEDNDFQINFEHFLFDAIVCTLVLCNVQDLNKTLEFIKKKLKNGGKLILLEHIRSKNSSIGLVQDLIAPIWKITADGCNLNRNTDQHIISLGFQKLEEEYFSKTVQFYCAVWQKPEKVNP